MPDDTSRIADETLQEIRALRDDLKRDRDLQSRLAAVEDRIAAILEALDNVKHALEKLIEVDTLTAKAVEQLLKVTFERVDERQLGEALAKIEHGIKNLARVLAKSERRAKRWRSRDKSVRLGTRDQLPPRDRRAFI